MQANSCRSVDPGPMERWPAIDEQPLREAATVSSIERLFERAGLVLHWLTAILLLVTILVQGYMVIQP